MVSAKEYVVTAIVSTYASERFIRGAMEDLVAQTIFPRIEVIVIDSASPEAEGEIVGEYARRFPENVFYHRIPRREPLYASWNRAIRMARGKYLTSANADDRHSPEAFERLAGALDTDPEAAVAYGDYAETNLENDTIGPRHAGRAVPGIEFRRDRLLVKCFVGAQPMWRRSLHGEFGFFREDLRIAADWDFWNRVARRHRFTRVPCLTGLVYFSDAATNLSLADPGSLRRESEEVADLHLLYYWADLIPRVTVVWIQDGDSGDWRRSLGSVARQSVRPDRLRILGETPGEALDVWKEFPGLPFGEAAFPRDRAEPHSVWDRVLSSTGSGYVAYLKGTDAWEKDHLRRLTDWMGETNYRLAWIEGEGGGPPPGVSALAHHVDAIPTAKEILHGPGVSPGDPGWLDAMSGRVAGTAVPRDAFYPLRGEVSWQARDRLRDAAGHFFRKGEGAAPRRIDVTVRPFFTFLKEYLRCAGRGEGDAFGKAVWRGWNNWVRYSLRAEANRHTRGEKG
ncbi:MAG TPA: glycosyltransferase [Candidatus Deferrimicrobiaceae bacterium]